MGEVISESRSNDLLEQSNRPLREVTICCRKCKKSFKLTYKEEGNPHIIAFRNMGFKCDRCSREKHVDRITEGALLRNVTLWNAVYI